MSLIFEVGSTDGPSARLGIKTAMSHVETLCGQPGGVALGDIESRAGWSFFRLKIGSGLHEAMAERCASMIDRYRGGKPDERFAKFLGDYLEHRGCAVRLRMLPAG